MKEIVEEEIVPFDPNEKFHAHYLVEPHRNHVLVDIRSAARELGLDPERVARFVFGGIETHDELPHVLLSLLKEAATHFPPQEALEILEREDTRTLQSRVLVLQLLSSTGIPLYTREELADLLEASMEHLKRDQADLILRGHPR